MKTANCDWFPLAQSEFAASVTQGINANRPSRAVATDVDGDGQRRLGRNGHSSECGD